MRQVTGIWIYPIKSLGGISVSHARVMPKGLEGDRRMMLVDDNNTFLTQRNHSTLALFRLAFHPDGFEVSFGNDRLIISPADDGNAVTATVWDDTVSARELNASYSKWFSERLGFSCRLVMFPEENPRKIDPRYNVGEQDVSFADAYPILAIGQSSLDDLNGRMKSPLPMNRFRPNVVFSGGEPFEEDQWREFSIGNERFVGVKPCKRCVMTTVDQETAERGAEPLATLSTYRKRDNGVYFGQNVIALTYGQISVGDPIIF